MSLLDFIRRQVGVGELVRRRVDRNSRGQGDAAFFSPLLLSEIIFMYNGTSRCNVSTLSSNRR